MSGLIGRQRQAPHGELVNVDPESGRSKHGFSAMLSSMLSMSTLGMLAVGLQALGQQVSAIMGQISATRNLFLVHDRPGIDFDVIAVFRDKQIHGCVAVPQSRPWMARQSLATIQSTPPLRFSLALRVESDARV